VSERLRRVVVLTHHLAATSEAALRELAAARERLGLELAMPADELAKHPSAGELGYQAVDEDGVRAADVCLVFGGDGTILRALGRLLGSGVPTVGVNFGNVGFLAGLPAVGGGAHPA
jgi:NAD+ kinase